MKTFRVLMKPFAYVRFCIQLQLIELLQQKQTLPLNEFCHVQGSFMMFVHQETPEWTCPSHRKDEMTLPRFPWRRQTSTAASVTD